MSECISINELTKCHESCKTCSNSSICGNPYACTSCHPEQYKIAESFSDALFQCSKKCEHFSYYLTDDYWFCDFEIPNSTANFERIEEVEAEILALSSSLMIFPQISNDVLIFLCCAALFVVVMSGVAMFVFRCWNSTKTCVCPSEKELMAKNTNKAEAPHVLQFQNNIMFNDFKKGRFIGEGSYSEVFEGTLKINNDWQEVAIKTAKNKGRKSIYKEVHVYCRISHPHILPAFGVFCGIQNMLFLALRKYNLRDFFNDYGKDLKILCLYQYCIQISDAMKYLHSMEILHCDLKIDNILVKDDKGDEIEISDFGCAIDLKNDHEPKFNGTITHTSYELLKRFQDPHFHAIPSKASDVWAFAVTVWQIFKKCSKFPADFINPNDTIKNYENGKKLPMPNLISEPLWRHTIIRCFDLDPMTRPSMQDLWKIFTNYQAALRM